MMLIEGSKERGRPRKKCTNYFKQQHIINVIIIKYWTVIVRAASCMGDNVHFVID